MTNINTSLEIVYAPEFFGEDEFSPKDFGYCVTEDFEDLQNMDKQPKVKSVKVRHNHLITANAG